MDASSAEYLGDVGLALGVWFSVSVWMAQRFQRCEYELLKTK